VRRLGANYAQKLDQDFDQVNEGLAWINAQAAELTWEYERMLYELQQRLPNAEPHRHGL
jgi:hypothetical protein